MIRCASGSIQVVTKVARLCCGSPSRNNLPDQAHRVQPRHAARGKLVLGYLLGQEPVAVAAGQVVCAGSCVGMPRSNRVSRMAHHSNRVRSRARLSAAAPVSQVRSGAPPWLGGPALISFSVGFLRIQ